ncbi:MAG TPA: hypothetical protein PK883_00385 [Anaerolineaceae bacterium]|nr:hypothetical protein [Anaerolineaceae bacterium]
MSNSISLASKFLPILDEIYKKASLTSRMDAMTKPVEFGAANEVKVFKTSMVGLGTYSRATGYPSGDVTGAWETMQLAASRGRSFSIDRMDNEETLGQAFGTLVGEFIRTQVVPEVDAYRFAKYAGTSGISTVSEAALTTASAVLAAFDVAMTQLDNDDVPDEGRILYISSAIYGLLKASVSRTLANETAADRRVKDLDGVEVVVVPQTRFYTQVTLDAGSSSNAGGFSKTASTGRDINFLLVHPSAVLQPVKHSMPKIFSPDENQTADAWLFQYRLYHDAFAYENKVDGIYLHKKNS